MDELLEMLMATPPGERQNAAARLEGARTDLRQACSEDRPEMARAALAAGAEPNLVDAFGETPLGIAASRGSLGAIRELLSAGARVDQRGRRGWTPLLRALSSMPCRAQDVCEALLRAGADPTLRAQDACRALAPDQLAQTGGLAAMWDDKEEGFDGDDALRVALSAPTHEASDVSAIARALIAAGAGLDAANREGVTPLMVAAAMGRAPELEMLLEAGADVSVRDVHGADALCRALAGGNEALAPALLRAGADPRVPCPGLWGESPCEWSRAHHAEDWLVRDLADRKAELDAREEAEQIGRSAPVAAGDPRKAPRI